MEVCVQGSVSAFTSKPINVQASARRSANYHPSVWGEHFLRYATDLKEPFTAEEEIEHARLKEEIRKMLIGIPDKCLQKLDLIDAIQCLGLSYHFESEIKASLLSIYNAYGHESNVEDNNDLYVVSLRFRLLRQNGHYISCDVFDEFKDSKGKFRASLENDMKGLLSLYEASNFRVHGETILEEALLFTTTQLESMMPNLSGSRATKVKHALNMPIQKTLTRLGGLQYLTVYKEDESFNDAVLKFAKLDFNRLQKMHQMELCKLTKWWKELDCARTLPFARDRLVECYFWILGVYFEPHYGLARRFLTKVIALASIIDDIYDVSGTFDELIIFTDAIERWDIRAVNQLPSYLRHFYQVLLDVYNEMEEELAKRGISGRVDYAKEKLKQLTKAYFQEACWEHNGYTPTFDEYMKVSLISGGYKMLAPTSLVGMVDIATEESLAWMTNEPFILRAASVICRLMDDMVEHESEKERGEVASAVACYMKEYGVSKKVALDEFHKQVTDAWKDINKELLSVASAAVSMPILERVLNLARVMNLLYKDEDCYTNPTIRLKELITSVLVDPVKL